MRDGNFCLVRLDATMRTARDLPMRDGNSSQVRPVGRKPRSPRSSYEGWKLRFPPRQGRKARSPRSSYEGWKQFPDQLRRLHLRRPRSSYEGWKLPRSRSPVIACPGPRSSYEGWKQISQIRQMRTGWARDLPMRDGNSSRVRTFDAYPGCPRSSYEGWKPWTMSAWVKPVDCPRSSYEGWKLALSAEL